MDITTIGLDLAKSIFQVHGVDANGRVVIRKSLRRAQMTKREQSRWYFLFLPYRPPASERKKILKAFL
jgi:hypothetical protein